MVLALVLRDETATGSVIWVSVVSLQALADALVIGGTALRVGWAVEELTDWPTLESALRVRAAHLVARTLGVRGAGWHGDQLTPPGQRVSQMTRGALTEWPVVLDRADLCLSAGHDPAGVHAGSPSVDVDAAHGAGRTLGLGPAPDLLPTSHIYIERIARESLAADAGAVMVVGDTPRVGAALALAAGVDTSAGSFHCLTNFIVAALEVVFAAGHLTSISKIVGVSIKSRLTKALAD